MKCGGCIRVVQTARGLFVGSCLQGGVVGTQSAAVLHNRQPFVFYDSMPGRQFHNAMGTLQKNVDV